MVTANPSLKVADNTRMQFKISYNMGETKEGKPRQFTFWGYLTNKNDVATLEITPLSSKQASNLKLEFVDEEMV
jgi:hypothetical protein